MAGKKTGRERDVQIISAGIGLQIEDFTRKVESFFRRVRLQSTDSNGRISHDGHQFLDIYYNVLNFPKEITNDEGMTATYTYLSDGSKRSVSTHDSLGKLYRGSCNLIDFGARNYDPWSARWTTTAPMAQKYFSMSPYNYCAGNPVMYLDRNGEKGVKS